MQSSMKLGEAMYKQSEAAQGDAAGPEASQEQAQDEKVVDADFEEVK